ncbi:xanthine dehydrogenase family protein molybdopterin-binding subunit [Roseomonas nepalensis]|uniref:Xanthine dehydrogenase family protein molybdopterin-binding subunit n=1 Tax=Muricoccus nepalensis TaxID=1854500 RepID=A0A502GEI4_9PROT|nr:xanthine dehydrogenase family protein molybdopterin-binding subunit [Roseomonas nepalensis]TPG59690.1 xanthine dehydrogenase family protein molybdopterin-binding subunit [Roseomonas nepalensis]
MTTEARLDGAASTIGRPTPPLNAREKLTGRALYAADFKMPGMLHLKVLRSPHAHARIVSVDTAAARALPGVHAVLCGEDTPDRLTGVHRKQHRILATSKVRFVGEEVVAVAAIDEETARDALDLVRVAYEPLPLVRSMDEALRPGAAEVHENTGNLSIEYNVERGDVDAAFAGAALVHEATYETTPQYPGYLEPMATVAWVDGDGRLVVRTSTQSVFLQRNRYADALGLPVSAVRVIQATVGGAFGGKVVEECNSLICAWMAHRLGRPVSFVNSRLDDFLGARSSPAERITLRMGVDAEGHIIAKEVRILADCGAYEGLATHVLQVSLVRSDNMHRHLRNVRSNGRLAFTNHPPRGAVRGFGGPQAAFALNSHMTEMAQALGIDSVDFMKRNAVRAGDTSVHGFELGSAGLAECFDQVSEAIGWAAKRERPRDRGTKRRGIGFAGAIHVSGNREMGNWDGSIVTARVTADGRVTLSTGESDMGQGAYTMLAQCCASELGIPVSRVTVLPTDTDLSPYGHGSIASRVTILAGNAAIRAGRAIRGRLLALASEVLGVPEGDLTIAGGEIYATSTSPNRRLTFGELSRLHLYRHGGEELRVTATYDPPTFLAMSRPDQYGNVAPGYSFAAQAVEVEVDTETGQVEILATVVSDDCGRALNPLAVHGQTCGAAAMGIGWALYEEMKFEDCRLLNGNLADYTMPTAGSLPHIRSEIVESMEPNGPYGAKGASETAMLPGAAAIANAVHDAVGVRIRELPITPEKILAGLRARASADAAPGASHA